jgi:hypothetical protein
MIWVPGSAFEVGSGAIFDGSHFARDGIVCVTINYRVGADAFSILGRATPTAACSIRSAIPILVGVHWWIGRIPVGRSRGLDAPRGRHHFAYVVWERATQLHCDLVPSPMSGEAGGRKPETSATFPRIHAGVARARSGL